MWEEDIESDDAQGKFKTFAKMKQKRSSESNKDRNLRHLAYFALLKSRPRARANQGLKW